MSKAWELGVENEKYEYNPTPYYTKGKLYIHNILLFRLSSPFLRYIFLPTWSLSSLQLMNQCSTLSVESAIFYKCALIDYHSLDMKGYHNKNIAWQRTFIILFLCW